VSEVEARRSSSEVSSITNTLGTTRLTEEGANLRSQKPQYTWVRLIHIGLTSPSLIFIILEIANISKSIRMKPHVSLDDLANRTQLRMMAMEFLQQCISSVMECQDDMAIETFEEWRAAIKPVIDCIFGSGDATEDTTKSLKDSITILYRHTDASWGEIIRYGMMIYLGPNKYGDFQTTVRRMWIILGFKGTPVYDIVAIFNELRDWCSRYGVELHKNLSSALFLQFGK